MECKLEAHRIVTLSLGKMYSARGQRGGLKLHKGLLVSLVLRSARQVYVNGLDCAAGADPLWPAGPTPSPLPLFSPASPPPFPGVFLQAEQATEPRTAPWPRWLPPDGEALRRAPRCSCCSCSALAGPRAAKAPCPPCCVRKRSAPGPRGAEEAAGPSLKKPRREEEASPEEENMDTSNVASLISIFGSSFSGLLSKKAPGGRSGRRVRRRRPEKVREEEAAAPEAEPGKILHDESVLRTLNPWSTVIVAF